MFAPRVVRAHLSWFCWMLGHKFLGLSFRSTSSFPVSCPPCAVLVFALLLRFDLVLPLAWMTFRPYR